MLENSIGPHYAPFYDTYAAALGEKGKVDEAIKLVERAMAQNAQPMKKLQLRLEALKQSQVQQPISSTSNSSVPSSKQTATSSWEDEPVRILSLSQCIFQFLLLFDNQFSTHYSMSFISSVNVTMHSTSSLE